MIRQKYKKFLLKQGRSLIEMTLLFPGVATLFPIFTGIAFNLVLADETAKQPGRSSLPIAETTVIAVLILVSALLRWKLSGKSHLLAPMKPNKKPYINTNMEVYPENPNEIKALVALERFKASVLATRVPLAIASITLTIMISENPEWIMMGPAILIILLYGKFQVPKLSFLEQAIEELSYQQVSESIDMNDFKPSHIADLEKFQKADTTAPNQAVKPEMPEMPESPPPDELIHLQKNDDLEGIARYAWLDLSRSENQCSGFDYFPNGGMRNFYCHLKIYCTYEFLEKAAGIPIFLSGPHTSNKLNLNSKSDFGHYNPEFVRTLIQWTLPAMNDTSFLRLTQPVYDYFVRPLARTHFVVYNKWIKNPDLLKKESDQYQKRIEEKQNPSCNYEKFYYFLNPSFSFQEDTSEGDDDGYEDHDHETYNGNVVKTAAAFWMRRFIDGTAEDFYAGLTALLETYDKKFTKTARF